MVVLRSECYLINIFVWYVKYLDGLNIMREINRLFDEVINNLNFG